MSASAKSAGSPSVWMKSTRLPAAILDRLLHHAITINIRGDSYWLKEKMKAGFTERYSVVSWLQRGGFQGPSSAGSKDAKREFRYDVVHERDGVLLGVAPIGAKSPDARGASMAVYRRFRNYFGLTFKLKLIILQTQRSESGLPRGVTNGHDSHFSQLKQPSSSLKAATTGSKSLFPKFAHSL